MATSVNRKYSIQVSRAPRWFLFSNVNDSGWRWWSSRTEIIAAIEVITCGGVGGGFVIYLLRVFLSSISISLSLQMVSWQAAKRFHFTPERTKRRSLRTSSAGLQSEKCEGVLSKVLKGSRGGSVRAAPSALPPSSRLRGRVQIVHQLKEATLSTAGILATELRGSSTEGNEFYQAIMYILMI